MRSKRFGDRATSFPFPRLLPVSENDDSLRRKIPPPLLAVVVRLRNREAASCRSVALSFCVIRCPPKLAATLPRIDFANALPRPGIGPFPASPPASAT